MGGATEADGEPRDEDGHDDADEGDGGGDGGEVRVGRSGVDGGVCLRRWL